MHRIGLIPGKVICFESIYPSEVTELAPFITRREKRHFSGAILLTSRLVLYEKVDGTQAVSGIALLLVICIPTAINLLLSVVASIVCLSPLVSTCMVLVTANIRQRDFD